MVLAVRTGVSRVERVGGTCVQIFRVYAHMPGESGNFRLNFESNGRSGIRFLSARIEGSTRRQALERMLSSLRPSSRFITEDYPS